ncbi:bifunctional folylpolyglutamate synthase/dihydrofolate synthase [Sphingomonas spermidinifaciens]|uniref:tetrahydrofolate synthase n=1 Tax=Sphingomonas spermidinifaciens TaxID=1141889 RepID=A0A2A4B250_9SPHN|nr:Mur ligase family protein [Sphingomonas spermidinifaciens]PCD01764.1 bifunctional folylpolyglutamate synthase/dihydrofolate synthase [Sphingomonas spermidinifaciens]
MADHARSDDPFVQAQFDRLNALGPGADTLGLDRIARLLARVGDPHCALPPVFHVAGTNGKGSTCAFLRTALEAAGYRVHVYTSPHLVRFNERIRVAGTLIDDRTLASLMAEVLDAGGEIGASFFEVTTAAAFLAFARAPADACVIEVGLGGRLDATNIIPVSLVGAIARLGIDHQAFLGDTIEAIAGEKAGIARAGVPLVTLDQPESCAAVIEAVAERTGAVLHQRGVEWRSWTKGDSIRFEDARGSLELPAPNLPGVHQHENLALAAAMLRAQDAIRVPDEAIKAAATRTFWPARMQRLRPGPLASRVRGAMLLDGAHNRNAADAAAAHLAMLPAKPALILGVLANKDAGGILDALAAHVGPVRAVPVPSHPCHSPEALAAMARERGLEAQSATDVLAAVDSLSDWPGDVLILGSLYLAGRVLEMNDEAPS